MRVSPAGDPDHTLEDGCRFVGGGLEVARRVQEQLGQQAGAGPCRGLAIPAAGVADADPVTNDILDSDIDVASDGGRVVAEDEAPGVFRGDGHEIVTKEEGS